MEKVDEKWAKGRQTATDDANGWFDRAPDEDVAFRPAYVSTLNESRNGNDAIERCKTNASVVSSSTLQTERPRK